MSMPSEMPWQPRSRQQTGMQTEKQIVKKKGGRVHPRSGAGKIKDDGSTDSELLEVKDARRTHTIKGSDLLALFNRATRQKKEAQYVVYFTEADLTITGTITKGKG